MRKVRSSPSIDRNAPHSRKAAMQAVYTRLAGYGKSRAEVFIESLLCLSAHGHTRAVRPYRSLLSSRSEDG